MIAAAYLHDVVEKTDVELDEIRERFGPEVARLVDQLSEDPALDGYGERKRALRRRILDSDGDSVVIYAADRVANMRDWLKVTPEDRPACGERLGTTLPERLELWQEDVEELHEIDTETPFLAEMRSDLATLREQAPQR
jgi:(p)ppGpp synthase/HD superfamily hydrolase